MAVLEENNKKIIGDLILEEIPVDDYENVYKIINEKTKLKAIIAIHDTSLGPAVGGIRIYPFKTFKEALNDVLRLSKGMSYKSSITKSGLGGGKAVIIADPHKDKNKDLLLSFAEAIDILEGRYIGAEDSGCSEDDIMIMREKTHFISGLPHEKSSGNPSYYTAWGVLRGIQAVLKRLNNSKSIEGKTIALQGLGSVGTFLAEHLFLHGANVIACDVRDENIKKVKSKFNIEIVSPEEIYDVPCDIFSPCAFGGIINDETIAKLKCRAIAGCANNQLLDEIHGDVLHEKDILYAPDFVINGGGLINVACEMEKKGYNPKIAINKTNQIYDTLMSIFEMAESKNISPSKAALELAIHRIKNKVEARTTKLYFHH